MVDEVGGNGAPPLVPMEDVGAGPEQVGFTPVVAGETAAGPAVARERAQFVPVVHTPESRAAGDSRGQLPLTGLDALLLALGGALLLGVGVGVRSLSRSLA